MDKDDRHPSNGEWIPGAGNLLVRFDDPGAPEGDAARALGALASLTDAGTGASAPSASGPDSGAAGEPDGRAVEAFRARLDEILQVFPFNEGLSGHSAPLDLPEAESPTKPAPGEVRLPTRFGSAAGESGADLDAVAAECGLTPEEVVARFCAATYTVAFVGFAPGFPYLIGLPPELEVARLPSPRPRVPAGAVAIAGPFAGVYPSATPGGWRLLGAAEISLFDPAATPPARLAAGDRVRFVAR